MSAVTFGGEYPLTAQLVRPRPPPREIAWDGALQNHEFAKKGGAGQLAVNSPYSLKSRDPELWAQLKAAERALEEDHLRIMNDRMDRGMNEQGEYDEEMHMRRFEVQQSRDKKQRAYEEDLARSEQESRERAERAKQAVQQRSLSSVLPPPPPPPPMNRRGNTLTSMVH